MPVGTQQNQQTAGKKHPVQGCDRLLRLDEFSLEILVDTEHKYKQEQYE